MIIGKKHLALAALVIALGAAVYLNWQFAPSEELIETAVSDYALAEDAYSAEYASTQTRVTPTDADAVVETGKSSGSFESARSDRAAARKTAMETLDEIIGDPSMTDSQKTEAVNTKSRMAANTEKEASIEALIKAKDYSDCVVIISDAQVNVMLPSSEDGLTSADAAIIRDIVMGQIDISPSGIKLIEVK